MCNVFVIRDQGIVFKIDFSEEKGFSYQQFGQKAPDWRCVVMAFSYVLEKMKIPSKQISGRYTIAPDNTFDIRFIPILSSKDGEKCKLPITIEGKEIL